MAEVRIMNEMGEKKRGFFVLFFYSILERWEGGGGSFLISLRFFPPRDLFFSSQLLNTREYSAKTASFVWMRLSAGVTPLLSAT